jgi:Protein of unknown function (DUF3187)
MRILIDRVKQGRARYASLCVGLTLLYTGSTSAQDPLLQPLAINNNNPFIRVYGIPRMDAISVRQKSRFDISLDAASSFTDAESRREFIVMDGETYRLTLHGAYALNADWDIGVELPFVQHSGGFLDSFILNWHDFFGLPQLGRDAVENNQLNYRYIRDGRERSAVNAKTSGIGDVSLSLGRTLPIADHAAVRAQLKLPSGDSASLFGSGGTDAALWTQLAHGFSPAWHTYGGAGVAYLGPGDVLPELQRHWVGFASLGLIWQPLNSLAFKLQFDGQTAVYQHTSLRQLGGNGAQLTLGGSIRLGKRWLLDLGVTEDEIAFDVSPDVSFHLRLRHDG